MAKIIVSFDLEVDDDDYNGVVVEKTLEYIIDKYFKDAELISEVNTQRYE